MGGASKGRRQSDLSYNGAVKGGVLRKEAHQPPNGMLSGHTHTIGAAVACLCAATACLAPGQSAQQRLLVVIVSPRPDDNAVRKLNATCECHAAPSMREAPLREAYSLDIESLGSPSAGGERGTGPVQSRVSVG